MNIRIHGGKLKIKNSTDLFTLTTKIIQQNKTT